MMGGGREALGVTEADPALPGIVLISLNAKLIAERDYLKRSTLAHEFGHAVFDGPSMLRQAGQPAFAMVTPNEGHLGAASRGRGGMDWREFRANEFMGALLAPRALLHRELVRRAIALRLPLRNAGEGEPVLPEVYDGRCRHVESRAACARMYTMSDKYPGGAASTTFTVRVGRTVKRRLEKLAESTGRSRSFLAAEALNAYLDVNEWQIAGIRKAMASLDLGTGIPHADVKRTVRSWARSRPTGTRSARA